jgi:hypothetical protein
MTSAKLTADYPAGFERSFLERLEGVVQALPGNAATLQTESSADYVIFKIFPTNRNSAPIEGEASTQGGIALKIGRATRVELSTNAEDRFFLICRAVFTSHFTESLISTSKGRTLYSRIVLSIDGRQIRLGGHQLFWWLFPNKRKELFSYAPYA